MSGSKTPGKRRPLIWLAVGAVVAILLGHALPPAMITMMKLLDEGESTTYTSAPAETQMLDVAALLDSEVPEANAGRAECGDPATAPLSCFQLTGPATTEKVVTTSGTDETFETEVDAAMSLSFDGEQVLGIDDHQRVSSDSTFPVPEPAAHTTVTLPRLDAEVSSTTQVREGLQYFFPFTTERRSYPYFDVLAQQSAPLDYVDETEIGGLDAFKFSQSLEAVNLIDALARSQDSEDYSSELTTALAERTSGAAERFYSPDELTELGIAADEEVSLQPYYTVDRTAWVEPSTGTILDFHEHRYLYFAGNQEQAQAMAEAAAEGPHPELTLLHTSDEWDAQTKQQQMDTASPIVAQLRGLQILSWFANFAALIFIAGFVITVIRRRERRARELEP